MPIEKKSEGFGDTVQKFTDATGISRVVKAIAKVAGINDCGCGARQQSMNKAFPYKKSK
jgi:hypothetical protein